MSTRLKQSQVSSFITTSLVNVRNGLNDELADGIVVEIPEKLDFNLEVVIDGQTMTSNTATTETQSGGETNSISNTSTNTGSSTESSSGSSTNSGSTADSSSTVITRIFNQFINS